jgi:manganese/zinc/iron transport system substrate-binding protein
MAGGILLHGAGCGSPAPISTARRGGGPIGLVTSTALVADLARNVGGDNVDVVSLMGEGVDPHLYKGSPRDVRALADAELILANGLHLEGKLITVFERLGRHKPTHLLGEALTEKRQAAGMADPWIRDEGAPDPHCWFDVSLWREFTELTVGILAGFDPANEAAYRQRGEAYRRQLDSLDAEIRAAITRLPADRRLLITSHDAFRYFGRAYGIQVEGIQGLSTESESGVRRTNELVDLVVARKVPAIFVESSVADDNVMALVEGARAQGHALRVGGSLFSDAPGAFGTPEGTYLGMMRHNVRTFVESMTDQATAANPRAMVEISARPGIQA